MSPAARREITFGDVLVVALPTHVPPGREQQGYRPVIVAGLPGRVGTPRYPLFIGVPLTTRMGGWARRSPVLYPLCRAGSGGLPRDSVALLDHLRSIDPQRVVRHVGTLPPEDLERISEGLRAMLPVTGSDTS